MPPKVGARGRKPMLTPQVMDEIVTRMTEGESLRSICRDPHMPSFVSIFKWEQKNPFFAEALDKARINGTHYLAGECLEIADRADLEPAARRVMIDTRMRLMGFWHRSVYGSKTEIVGKDGGAIQIESKSQFDVRLIPPEERDKFRELLLLATSKPQETGEADDIQDAEYEFQEDRADDLC